MALRNFWLYFADKTEVVKEHCYLICMGSNTFPEESLKLGRRLLGALDPDIVFGPVTVSDPLFFQLNKDKFYNQLGMFRSALEVEEVTGYCKKTERAAGRTPREKQREIVKLDVDLLMADDTVLRPEEMRRGYIREGMEALGL